MPACNTVMYPCSSYNTTSACNTLSSIPPCSNCQTTSALRHASLQHGDTVMPATPSAPFLPAAIAIPHQRGSTVTPSCSMVILPCRSAAIARPYQHSVMPPRSMVILLCLPAVCNTLGSIPPCSNCHASSAW